MNNGNARKLALGVLNEGRRRFDAMLGIVSRMSWQKGLDLVLENLPFMLESGMQLALLGSGDAYL